MWRPETSYVKLTFIHNEMEGCPNASDKNINSWLQKLQRQLIDIENLVDATKVDSSEKKKTADDLSSENDINQLKEANLRLDLYSDELRKIISGFRMEKSATSGAEIMGPLEKILIGREVETLQLYNFLLSGSKGHANPRLICMVGKPGVGKSALARHIFDSPIIRAFFDLRGWIVKPTLAGMIESLVSAFNAEGSQIYGVIKMKRFLIVFDDVPNNFEDIWTMLDPTFATAGPESAVLVITMSEHVAARIGELVGVHDRLMLHPLPESAMSINSSP